MKDEFRCVNKVSICALVHNIIYVNIQGENGIGGNNSSNGGAHVNFRLSNRQDDASNADANKGESEVPADSNPATGALRRPPKYFEGDYTIRDVFYVKYPDDAHQIQLFPMFFGLMAEAQLQLTSFHFFSQWSDMFASCGCMDVRGLGSDEAFYPEERLSHIVSQHQRVTHPWSAFTPNMSGWGPSSVQSCQDIGYLEDGFYVSRGPFLAKPLRRLERVRWDKDTIDREPSTSDPLRPNLIVTPLLLPSQLANGQKLSDAVSSFSQCSRYAILTTRFGQWCGGKDCYSPSPLLMTCIYTPPNNAHVYHSRLSE